MKTLVIGTTALLLAAAPQQTAHYRHEKGHLLNDLAHGPGKALAGWTDHHAENVR